MTGSSSIPMSNSTLVSPQGVMIIGTYEVIKGTANAFFEVDADGTIETQYSGETTVDWDSQLTVLNEEGERLVVDDQSNIWPINQCKSYKDYLAAYNSNPTATNP